MPAPKNPSHAGSGGHPYTTSADVPTLAVEREDPDLIASFDDEIQDEAVTGHHPNDFGTGGKTGFASDSYSDERHKEISEKGGHHSSQGTAKPAPNPHANLDGVRE